MKALIALTIVGLASVAYFGLYTEENSALQAEFQSFIQNYKANYANSAEFEFRMKAFEKNLETIAQMNEENPLATFGVNQFADRTEEEMQAMLTKRGFGDHEGCDDISPSADLVDVDWRDLMGTPKNQGSCGSCWAFATTAVTEGRYALFQGQKQVTTRFSEQSLVDCDTRYNAGCNGGEEYLAFQYWEQNDVVLESDYPYKGRDGTCQEAHATGIRVKTCTNLNANNKEIVSELQNGPVDIGVDASRWSFYRKGVMTSCPGRGNNHAVTLVAYTAPQSANEVATVTIRNSWGEDWGEKGHIRLPFDSDNCGWQDDVHSIYFE
ncbi:unnamed protein product [Moneuplotes crassus]|uniref:Papain family cysteine protease n=1 Tax=Euplotes crassus TaxID=5936 RepID=A0AAD2CYK1_EUPCR|nr:unnamed protein product [Moneuplotes crassus]